VDNIPTRPSETIRAELLFRDSGGGGDIDGGNGGGYESDAAAESTGGEDISALPHR
jgi:hypothetical protein